MTILIFLSHPAQFLFYRNPVIRLREKGHRVNIVIKTKDVLRELLDEAGWEYQVINQKKRSKSYFSFFQNLLIRDNGILRIALKTKPDLLMGSDASVAHVGKLLGIPCITTLEDDYPVIRNLARLTYPFTSHILTPEPCNVGKWQHKKVAYKGYMKLSYLHPVVFQPDRSKIKPDPDEKYFLIRLSGLEAHHDFGIKGVSEVMLDKIIDLLKPQGRIYITSEKPLPERYQEYILKIAPSAIHHYLSFAQMLICDSQSMAVEASVLGTPNIRISSFKGKISVLEELEKKYGLTTGFLPGENETILSKIAELLNSEMSNEKYPVRSLQMLSEKIDVASFLVWFIEYYPRSVVVMNNSPGFQNRFLVDQNKLQR
jgi:uncharacterized protein